MNSKSYFSFYFLFIIKLTTTESAQILSIFGYPGEMQYNLIEPLLKKLAERGHHVTSISNYPQKETLKNFRDVVIEENRHLFDNLRNYTLDNVDGNFYAWMDNFYSKALEMCENVLSNTVLQKLFTEKQFDLIILDIFMSETLFGLGELLRAPIIGFSIMETNIDLDNMVGNISPASYIPTMAMNIKYSDTMNFWQRFLNVMITAMEWAHYKWIYFPMQKKVYDMYFPNATLGFYEAQKNVSLILVNDHFSLNNPRPYVTNMIQVAGMDLNENPQEISNDLKQLLENAKNGIIYMKINWTHFKMHKLRIFLRQISLLKETILWKTTTAAEFPLTMPANVYIEATFPQTAILAHPNTKLFICQGCASSIVESIYYAKPILGLMCYNNEEDYVDQVAKLDNAISIKCDMINEKSVNVALQELLYNPRYREISETLSYRFRDQHTKPIDRAIYWVEYVLRHRGAAHLRCKGQNLSMLQYYNIDVYIVVLAVFGCFIYITNFLINFIKLKSICLKNVHLLKKLSKKTK